MIHQMKSSNTFLAGVFYAVAAFSLWGMTPLYWNTITVGTALEVVIHRIVWGAVFAWTYVLIRGKLPHVRSATRSRRTMTAVATAAVLVSGNWFIYVYAVSSGHVVDASLGYYINPLISIFFGMVFLKEELTRLQVVALLSAAVGVAILTIQFGVFPWISVSLAVTFALYGLIKKKTTLDTDIALALELLFALPVALIFAGALAFRGQLAFGSVQPAQTVLLIGAGVVTAVPLLLFAMATRLIPLSNVGFIQYIAPTFMLLIGVGVYGEPFPLSRLAGFLFVWLALALYTLSTIRRARRSRAAAKG
jgi:chloramphenicol-sensitive protein RarD